MKDVKQELAQVVASATGGLVEQIIDGKTGTSISSSALRITPGRLRRSATIPHCAKAAKARQRA